MNMLMYVSDHFPIFSRPWPLFPTILWGQDLRCGPLSLSLNKEARAQLLRYDPSNKAARRAPFAKVRQAIKDPELQSC